MTILTYLFGYIAVLVFFVLVAMKARKFMSHPMHIRWELYPVAHEGARAAWGGSYLEEVDWWKKPRTHSFLGMAKGLAEEMLLLHLTYVHNRDLWYRTYSFHGGLYLLFGSFGLTFLGAIFGWFGLLTGQIVGLIELLAQVCSLVGFIGVLLGSIALLHRRLTSPSLKIYTTPEHYFNLIIFLVYALIGLVAWMTTPSLYIVNRDFLMSFLTFGFAPLPNGGLVLLTLYTFFLIAFVPATHMAHFFMKFFTWHNIRWDDTPTLDDVKINAKIAKNLGKKPTWSASHIAGDGNKTWADIATTNPNPPKE